MELSEWREEVAGVVAEAIREHADHMEMYTLPALKPGFMEGWSHALRLLRRDADFIESKALASPALARLLVEARAGALREAAEELAVIRESVRAGLSTPPHEAARIVRDSSMQILAEAERIIRDRAQAESAEVPSERGGV